jgi:hypothetical protein
MRLWSDMAKDACSSQLPNQLSLSLPPPPPPVPRQVFWPPLRPSSFTSMSTGDRKATRVRNYMACVLQRFWRRTVPRLCVGVAHGTHTHTYPSSARAAPVSLSVARRCMRFACGLWAFVRRGALRAHITMTKANHRMTPGVIKLQSRFRGARSVLFPAPFFVALALA